MEYNRNAKIDMEYHLYRIYTDALKEGAYLSEFIKNRFAKIELYKDEAYKHINDPFIDDYENEVVNFCIKRIKINIQDIKVILDKEEKMYSSLSKKIYPSDSINVMSYHNSVLNYKNDVYKMIEDVNDTCDIINKKVEMIKKLRKVKTR